MIKSNLNSVRPQSSAYQPGELIIRTKGGASLQSGSVVEDLNAKVLDVFDSPGGLHKSESAGDFLHLKLPKPIPFLDPQVSFGYDKEIRLARVTLRAPSSVAHLQNLCGRQRHEDPRPGPPRPIAPLLHTRSWCVARPVQC